MCDPTSWSNTAEEDEEDPSEKMWSRHDESNSTSESDKLSLLFRTNAGLYVARRVKHPTRHPSMMHVAHGNFRGVEVC